MMPEQHGDAIMELTKRIAGLENELRIAQRECCNQYFWDGNAERVKREYGVSIEAEEGESDPNGLNPHTPGAKLDAGKPMAGMILGAFARALNEVIKVGTYGAEKYSLNGWLEVPDGERRYTDAMMRHWLAQVVGEKFDESGLRHGAQVAWNALARLELELRHERQ